MPRSGDSPGDPTDLNGLAKTVTALDDIVTGGFNKGSPQNPLDDSDTGLAGGGSGSHNGTTDNINGSWVEVDFTAIDTAVAFRHNLGVILTGVTDDRNVRWEIDGLRHDADGIAGSGLLTAVSLTGSVGVVTSAYGNIGNSGGHVMGSALSKIPFGVSVLSLNMTNDLVNERIVNVTGETIVVAAYYNAVVAETTGATSSANFIIRQNGVSEAHTGRTILADATGQIRNVSGGGLISLDDDEYIELWGVRGATAVTANAFSLWCHRVDLSITGTTIATSETASTEGLPMEIEFQDGDAITTDSIELRLRAPGRTVDGSHPVRATLFFTPAVRG